MGYRVEIPYHCWYGIGSQWDVSWDGVFMGHPNGMSHWDPIGMLFLEYDCCNGVTFGSHND